MLPDVTVLQLTASLLPCLRSSFSTQISPAKPGLGILGLCCTCMTQAPCSLLQAPWSGDLQWFRVWDRIVHRHLAI